MNQAAIDTTAIDTAATVDAYLEEHAVDWKP